MWYDGLFYLLDDDELAKQLMEDKKKVGKMNQNNTVEMEVTAERYDIRNIFEITKVYFDLLTNNKIKSDIDDIKILKAIMNLSNVFKFNYKDLDEDCYETTIRDFAKRNLLKFYGKDSYEEEKLKICDELRKGLKISNSKYDLKVKFKDSDEKKIDYLIVTNKHNSRIFKIIIDDHELRKENE